MVPVAVYGLHFPFSAFNTLWVFLLPDRVLSLCVCRSVRVRLFVDLAGRLQSGAPPVLKPVPKSFPLKEIEGGMSGGWVGRFLTSLEQREVEVPTSREFLQKVEWSWFAWSFVSAAAIHSGSSCTCPVVPELWIYPWALSPQSQLEVFFLVSIGRGEAVALSDFSPLLLTNCGLLSCFSLFHLRHFCGLGALTAGSDVVLGSVWNLVGGEDICTKRFF